jgi:catechol 2,3-dioxygenase-like lactoylglutathione lyase family enzyme
MMKIADDGIVIGLVVRDAEALIYFYQNLLGMKLVASEPMDEGGTKHYLKFKGGYIKLFAPSEPPEIRPQGGLSHTSYKDLAFVVTNLQDVCRVLEDKGVRFVSTVQTTDNGTQWTVIADPEGNHIELAQTG